MEPWKSSSTDRGEGAAPAEGAASESRVAIRKATIDDVPRMAEIINGYASQGLMLSRSQHQIYQLLRDFTVAVHDDQVVGCGALNIVWRDLCEVRSLAVAEAWLGKTVGRHLAQSLLEEAQVLGIARVFALTYRQRFFEHLGFHVVPHEALPHKIWGDCLNCPKYPNCDEIAMMLNLKNPVDEEKGI